MDSKKEKLQSHLVTYVKMFNMSPQHMQKEINDLGKSIKVFQTTKKQSFKKGDLAEIQFEKLKSSYQFYGSKIGLSLNFEELKSLLKENGENQVVIPQRGLICCTALNDERYRAEILKLYDDQTCKVSLFDVGRIELVDWSKLWLLDSRLLGIEPMMRLFTLADHSRRLQSNCQQLTDPLIDQIQSKNGKFFVFMHQVIEECYVRLFIRFDDEIFYCVNHALADRDSKFWDKLALDVDQTRPVFKAIVENRQNADVEADGTHSSGKCTSENPVESLKVEENAQPGIIDSTKDSKVQSANQNRFHRGGWRPHANVTTFKENIENRQNGRMKQKNTKRKQSNRKSDKYWESGEEVAEPMRPKASYRGRNDFQPKSSKVAERLNNKAIGDDLRNKNVATDPRNRCQIAAAFRDASNIVNMLKVSFNKSKESEMRTKLQLKVNMEPTLPELKSKPELKPDPKLKSEMKLESPKPEPNQKSVAVKTQETIYSRRELVKLVHIESFSEFYVTILKSVESYKKLQARIQVLIEDHFEASVVELVDWKVNDNCLIRTDYVSNVQIWYRGNIKHTNSSESTFSVYLRDIGATLTGIKDHQMAKLDDRIMQVKPAVIKCRMTCIEPKKPQTNDENFIEQFKTLTEEYEGLAISIQGVNITDSIPVVLWGMKRDYPNALLSAKINWENLNRTVAGKHWATLTGHIVDYIYEKATAGESDDEEAKFEEYVEYLRSFTLNEDTNSENMNGAEHDFEFEQQKYKILNHIEPVYEWLPVEPLNKALLFIEPTYVSKSFEIYGLDKYRKWLAEEMGRIWMKRFNDMDDGDVEVQWSVDQPCFARYFDHRFYRAVVRKVNLEKRYCMVSAVV